MVQYGVKFCHSITYPPKHKGQVSDLSSWRVHLRSAEGKIKKRVKTLVHSHHVPKAAPPPSQSPANLSEALASK